MATPNPRDEKVSRPPPDAYPAERARQGRIILQHGATRAIFLAALAAIVLLALIWALVL